MKISGVKVKIINDSRGEETLEANLQSENLMAIASCPSGKSRGVHEVFVLEPKLAIQKFFPFIIQTTFRIIKVLFEIKSEIF